MRSARASRSHRATYVRSPFNYFARDDEVEVPTSGGESHYAVRDQLATRRRVESTGRTTAGHRRPLRPLRPLRLLRGSGENPAELTTSGSHAEHADDDARQAHDAHDQWQRAGRDGDGDAGGPRRRRTRGGRGRIGAHERANVKETTALVPLMTRSPVVCLVREGH